MLPAIEYYDIIFAMLSADQVSAFLAVIDNGSFSAAAKALRRNQSAISYAIANLENQLGVKLFDRTGGRPILSAAGHALLPDARKATLTLATLQERGRAFARGIEAEIQVAMDQFCPVDFVASALADFAGTFPLVRPHIHMELVHHALALVIDGTCPLGIIGHPMSSHESFDQYPLAATVDLRPFVAPDHPLGRTGRLDNMELDQHILFVTADRHGMSTGQELGVFTAHNWAASDLRVQQAMIRAGIGWGMLPAHMVVDDLAAGRLVPLDLAMWPHGGAATVQMMVVRRRDIPLGPAATWLLQRLIGGVPPEQGPVVE